MTGFNLPSNFNDNPEKLVRRVRRRTVPRQVFLSTVEPVTLVPRPVIMAQKMLREFSAPSAANILTGPAINAGENSFEIRTGLITMVKASPFCGKANEDVSAHLQQFLEICVSHSSHQNQTFLPILSSRLKVLQGYM